MNLALFFLNRKTKKLLAFLLCAAPLYSTFADSPIRPNVLLISIDTLRADHLGCYGYQKATPAIDSLAKQSVLFETVISQVPLTLPSHCTILTGLYPNQHGVRNNESFVLKPSFVTLAELFRKQNYSTGAVVGSFSLDSVFGIDQGFQFYEDEIGKGHDAETNRHAERRAEAVWKIGRSWLEKQQSPWFCFLHFFDPHTAYAAPKPHPQTYDGEIEYTDRVIGEILTFLQERNLLQNTIVVLLSDHGESLGEHGEMTHGVFLYDATLKVPLMISAPGFNPKRIANQVRLADVASTITELASIPASLTPGGKSLVPLMKGGTKDLPAYSETYYTNLLMGWAPLHSLRWSNKKWIDSPKPEFYNLSTDPKELKNIYTSTSVPAAARSELQQHMTATAASAAAEVDPETKEKLTSLGYVTGSAVAPVSSSFDPKDGIAVWDKIETAVQFAQVGDMKKSEQLFIAALQIQPDNVLAKKFLANVYRKEGQDEKAIPLLKSALQSKLHTDETRYDLAEVYYELKQYSEALQILSPLLQNDAGDIRSLRLAAVCAMNAKQYEQSARYFEQVLQKQPSDSDSLSLYARVLSYSKQDEKAVHAYEKLAAQRSLTEEEVIQVAAIYLTSNRPDEAEKYFQLAVQANAKSIPAWKGLALIHLARQQLPQALEAFLKAGDCVQARRIIEQSSELPPGLLADFKEQCKQ